MKFIWDTHKAKINASKHHVSFEEAIEAFFDPNGLENYDEDHSHLEARFNLIALSQQKLLFIVYTESHEGVIRIISARKADKKHEQLYSQNG